MTGSLATTIKTHEEFSKDRRTMVGIGGSDASAATGINPYKTAYQLYLEKVGEVEPEDLSDKEAVYWGIVHEDNVARRYAERMDCKVRRNNRTIRHPEFDFMMAHIDREVVGQDIILECKTAHEYLSGSWGKEFTSEVPEHYLIQCLHYLVVTGKSECHLAVLIGGNKHRIYIIKREDFTEECSRLPQVLQKFWDRVQRMDPPDPTTSGDLGLMYPTDTIPFVEANEADLNTVRALVGIKKQIKDLKKAQEDLEYMVKGTIAGAAKLQHQGKVIASWKGSTTRRLDQKKLKADHPDLCQEYTVEGLSRTLRTMLKEGE